MLWSPRLSLSDFHVKLTAKGLFQNLQLLSGCRKNTVVFHAVFSAICGVLNASEILHSVDHGLTNQLCLTLITKMVAGVWQLLLNMFWNLIEGG
uniref:Uncharacterized protein n=1 Tax=Hippocampus comes TaxID=109280 RepID=A0A3Q2XBW3_HIPCM